MKILITGSHGLVGSALVPALANAGRTVIRMIRPPMKPDEKKILWNPQTGFIEKEKLEGFDAVVHLAGENISTGRWTTEKKARIRDSRVKGTRLLAEILAGLKHKPKILASASAIGFYGSRGTEVMNEKSSPGSGFLAETCVEWESAAEPARQAGINVVHLRFGIILSAKGGALAKMLPPFKLGVGGKIGSGFQSMSWISITDVVGAVIYILKSKELDGPINIVSQQPVTNLEFTKALGKVLSRPTVFPLPAIAARFALGEMANELLLSSTCVIPSCLKASGYVFQHNNIEEALQNILGK
tara:strand:- start:41048 stop:41947 length:900 start_codon:yes stop_codon:yes gene_type:complete